MGKLLLRAGKDMDGLAALPLVVAAAEESSVFDGAAVDEAAVDVVESDMAGKDSVDCCWANGVPRRKEPANSAGSHARRIDMERYVVCVGELRYLFLEQGLLQVSAFVYRDTKLRLKKKRSAVEAR